MTIYEIYKDYYETFDGSSMILGLEAKEILMGQIQRDDYKVLVSDLFDEGYVL